MYKSKYLKYKKKYLELKMNVNKDYIGGAKLKDSYSQIGQDLQVINHYKNKENGYFIDVGANDGVTLSNTYLLEQKYGWTGICIEPLPSAFKKLEGVRNKSTICINKAVTDVTGQIVKFSVAEQDLLSGITEHLSNHRAEQIKKSPLQLIDVETITLTDILDQNNAPSFIEYMSLDTEGTELMILNGLDFDKYKIGYINLEHNWKEPQRTQIKKLLESKGYQYLRQNQWDDDYIYPNFDTLKKNP